MRRLKRLILALPLAIAAAPAWAQDEATITQAVGPELDAYTLCLKQQAHDLARSSDSEEDILRKALDACQAERQDLWAQLQVPPLNASAQTATDAVKQLNAAMWPSMISIIQAVRAN